MDHNFQTASIPTHRLHVHVKRYIYCFTFVSLLKTLKYLKTYYEETSEEPLFDS